jgi:hypothetical protein
MRLVQCWAVALWLIFTYIFELCYSLPKLRIKSAERRSGKTRLLQLLQHLASRAVPADYISPAMLPRVITKAKPTLLLDETDTFVVGNEQMRGVLNSGFDRGTYVMIGVPSGNDWIPTRFNAWCPQALAGIGDLPDTITDRSFTIELERKPRNVEVKRLRRRDIEDLQPLEQKIARWAEDNKAEIEDRLEGPAPKGLDRIHDRAADAWEPCIVIADLISEECGLDNNNRRYGL